MNRFLTRRISGDAEGIGEAAALIMAGEVVAIPTETVYGLAANAMNPAAVKKIFQAKGRPQDNPLIVHVDEISQVSGLVSAFPSMARRLAEAFWPGPLTMVLPKSRAVPDAITGGLDTVAVRMPNHEIARGVIRLSGCVLAAPSANLSGRPSPTSASHVLADMDGRIAAVLDGGDCAVGVESTVVDVSGDRPRILRPGGVTPEMLADATGGVIIDSAVEKPLSPGVSAPSPGMKYRHYAPRARVVLVESSAEGFRDHVNSHAESGVAAMCFDGETDRLAVPFVTYGLRSDPQSQARRVFDALRRLDGMGVHTVYCAAPDKEGMGLAVYNRLLRAASFEVVKAGG